MLKNRQMIGGLEYVAVVFMILSCRVVYSHTVNTDYHIPEITTFLFLFLFIAKYMQSGISLSVLKKWMFFLMPYYALTGIYAVKSVSDDVFLGYASRFLVTLPILVLLQCVYCTEGAENTLIRKYVNIMAAYAPISLFFWFFGSVLHVLQPNGSLLISWGRAFAYPSYYGIYFERQTESFLFYNGLRNMGIFTEAPMYGLCLVIAISAELFLLSGAEKQPGGKHISFLVRGRRVRKNKKPVNVRLILLTAALLTTITTTGMILLVFILEMWFIRNKPKNKVMAALVKVIAGSFVLAGGIALMYFIFITKASNTRSWTDRMAGYAAGFYTLMESPFFGSGYTENEQINTMIRTLGGGFTNSIAAVMGQGGLILLSIYLFPMLCGMAVLFFKKKRNESIFAVIVILEFILTTWANTYLMIFLLAYFYAGILTMEGAGYRKGVLLAKI